MDEREPTHFVEVVDETGDIVSIMHTRAGYDFVEVDVPRWRRWLQALRRSWHAAKTDV